MIRASRARVGVRQAGTANWKLLGAWVRRNLRLAKGYDARARTCRSIHSLRLGRENISWYPLLMACEEYGGRPIHTFVCVRSAPPHKQQEHRWQNVVNATRTTTSLRHIFANRSATSSTSPSSNRRGSTKKQSLCDIPAGVPPSLAGRRSGSADNARTDRSTDSRSSSVDNAAPTAPPCPSAPKTAAGQ